VSAIEHLRVVAPGAPTPARDERLGELLSAFGIGARAGALPGELSLGQRARLAVARALASDAAVLVMDEPLAHVDPARAGRYWDRIRSWLDAHGTSLVFATHSPKAALREAERAVCMREGRVIASGRVDDLYLRPASEQIMDCLGEGNWFEPDEEHLWFGVEAARAPGGPSASGRDAAVPARCLRPEEIALELDRESDIAVRRSRFLGALGEVELEHVPSGRRRGIYHRPAGAALAAGDRVRLREVGARRRPAFAKEAT
jgi:iron(III) transport system ATP-binding protein